MNDFHYTCYNCKARIPEKAAYPITIGQLYGYGRYPDRPNDDHYSVVVCRPCLPRGAMQIPFK